MDRRGRAGLEGGTVVGRRANRHHLSVTPSGKQTFGELVNCTVSTALPAYTNRWNVSLSRTLITSLSMGRSFDAAKRANNEQIGDDEQPQIKSKGWLLHSSFNDLHLFSGSLADKS